jgi:hypothetical protein
VPIWKRLGVQAEISPSPRDLLKKIANVIGNSVYRYIWRGHGFFDFPLHTSLRRRIVLGDAQLTAEAVRDAERALLASPRGGYDPREPGLRRRVILTAVCSGSRRPKK